MSKILYTVVTNNYDSIVDPIPQDGWTYIMYSDSEINSKVWQLRLIDEDIPKIHRKIKCLPHHYLPPHSVSVWLDANIAFKESLDKLLIGDLVFWDHPDRTTIYQESRACVELKKDDPAIIKEQMEEYFDDGFDGRGLVATGLIVRQNSAENKEMNELWWKEVERWSVRDQLSIPYVMNNLGITPSVIPFMSNCEYRGHLKKKFYV